MKNHYTRMIIQYWKDRKPKMYKELKKNGMLLKEAEELAEIMIKEIFDMIERTKDRDGGQAQSLAEEQVIANYLPS